MPKPAPGRPAGDELAELRRLLDIPDSVEWAELRAYWHDREQRTREVGDSLPDAIRLRQQRDHQLRDALLPTIEDGLRISVRRNPEAITETLFPLIGAMIRRAVAASMEQLTESLNQTLESSLSVQSLRWRLDASRRGVPFSQVLLERSQRFRVDQAFLIDRRTGLLLAHRSSPDATVRDPDVISGMLTAIQDFVQDAFSGPEHALESVKLGEYHLWIDAGPRAVLTCVVRGGCPPVFRGVMAESITAIHRDLGRELDEFDGDSQPFAAAAPVLDSCLLGQAPPVLRQRRPIGWWIAGAVVLTVLLWAGLTYWNRSERFRQFTARLGTQPGIVVTETERAGGKWHIRGLRDPLAAEPHTLAAEASMDPSALVWELKPFEAPEFAAQRTLRDTAQRIQRRVVHFETGVEAAPGMMVDFLADDLRLLADAAVAAGSAVRVHVIGSSDADGDAARNAELAGRRARNVLEALAERGLPRAIFDTQAQTLSHRSVRFEVELNPK